MTSTNVVAARLSDGRLLIAILDPTVPDHHSPLRHHLRRERPAASRGLKRPGSGSPAGVSTMQVSAPRENPGEGQPGQTPDRAPR